MLMAKYLLSMRAHRRLFPVLCPFRLLSSQPKKIAEQMKEMKSIPKKQAFEVTQDNPLATFWSLKVD